MHQLLKVFICCGLVFAFGQRVYAQGEPGNEFDELEREIEREDIDANETASEKRFSQEKINELADLAKLAPFQDIAVIQRRYFSKTKRWEAYLAGTGVVNDAFFVNAGGAARIAYYFSENWGVEGSVLGVFNSRRNVTKALEERGVLTTSLVTPQMYYGADVKWLPVYGKMAYRDQRIVPFDLYFSLGGGLTQTNSGESRPTVHIGSGQSFALSKSFAFRWDFSWNFYSAESSGTSSSFNNLYLTVGFSFYFPGTTYR